MRTGLRFGFLLAWSLTVMFAITDATAQKLLAPTPPMGWNSWDSYGRTLDEAQLKATADVLQKKLKSYGWQYVVIDEGWYIQNPEVQKPEEFKFTLDPNGRFLPTLNRFPSAKDDAGFKPVADYIHSLGLKFGIHIMRGIPREAVEKNVPIAGSPYHAAEAADQSDVCPWNIYNYGVKDSPAGQAYYDSIAKLYASWGVDFVKADCIADHPYKPDEIRMLSTALRKTGRPIVLSLSPGPTAAEHADYVAKFAEMWRISDDFWDHWGPWAGHEWSQGLLGQFTTASKWASFKDAGHWPDADMLPLGRLGPHAGEGETRDSKFTRDEQVTLMTLWSIFRSPLIMGGDLLSLDDWSLGLLTNPEVISVDQHSKHSHPVITTGTTIIWTAKPEQGAGNYVAVFNVSDTEQTIQYDWKAFGMTPSSYQVRDLWAGKELGTVPSLNVTLRPHASALYRVTMRP